jgi:cyclohexadienyl dehydratase
MATRKVAALGKTHNASVRTMKIIAIALCLLSGSSFAADLATVRSTGILRVGTTGDYKPFSFREPNGHYRGADITMARNLAATLGVRIVFVPTDWAGIMKDFASDRFDIAMGGVTILPAREKIAAFSTATLVDGKRPIARCADRKRFTSISAIDQPGVRVVVNPGGSNEDFARDHFPHAKLTVFSDNATIFDEIIAGRQDVMVTDGIEVDHQASLHLALCATAAPTPFTRLEKAYMLPRDADFVAAVDGWWADQVRSGAWQRALDEAELEP